MGSTGAGGSFGAGALAGLMRPGARAAGLIVYGAVAITFDTGYQLRSDVTVLHRMPEDESGGRWVPADHCTMPVLFLAPAEARSDRDETAARCARAGIPYLMRVEIVPRLRHAAATLDRLGADGRYAPVAAAVAGETLMVEEPFRLAFDPELLLAP